MKNPKVSFIIPVYNCVDFIEKCFYSIIEQIELNEISSEDIEIIFVNDGSTDDSLMHLNKIKKCYSEYVVVIDKENNGPSSARNLALRIANGKYICFVDSDDYILDGYLENVIKAIDSEKDIIQIRAKNIHTGNEIDEIVINDKYDNNIKEGFCKNFTSSCSYYIFLRVIKRSLIKDLYFNESIKLCEDALFLTECFSKAESILNINKPVYGYVHNEESITNNRSYSQIRDLEEIIKISEEIISYTNSYEKMLNYLGLMGNMLNIRRSMLVLLNKSIKIDVFQKVMTKRFFLLRKVNGLERTLFLSKKSEISLKYLSLSNLYTLLRYHYLNEWF